MGRLNDFRNRVAELIDASRDEEPEPQGYQGEERASGLIRGGVLEHDPDRDNLQFYRELYENVGPISSAIDNFASEVVEPGWYITCDSEETAEELSNYFSNVAILNTKKDVNASALMESMVREREIRGTVFVEKVTDDQGRNQALYPLQNDTITIYTKPGKAMLPAPDDNNAKAFDSDIREQRDQPPVNSDGEMGAFVQFDEIKPKWSNTQEVVYTRDQIIHWPRGSDVGNPRGVSRIASSSQRAEGLLEKLQDNDDAVKFKAWPQIIFELGDEDNPWSEEEVNNFIKHYDEQNMRPGLMQAVAGDVSVEEFAGETADIEQTLNFDISMIMSGLPGPVYATGGFSQNVAPAVAQAQQRQFVKEVKKTRRRLESIFTPYLQEVANDYNLDAADSVELHVARPDGTVAPEDIEGSIIRYTSDVQAQDADQGPQEPDQSGGTSASAPREGDPASSPSTRQNNMSGQSGQTSTADTADTADMSSMGHVGDASAPFRGTTDSITEELERTRQQFEIDEYDSVEELSDPRLVSTRDIESELQSTLSDGLKQVREEVLSILDESAEQPVQNADELFGVVERSSQSLTQELNIDGNTRSLFEDTIEKTLDTLGQSNHSPQMDVSFSTRHRQRSRFLSNNMSESFDNVVEDMLNYVGVQIRQAVQHGETPQKVANRIRETYSEGDLENRAQAMSRIEVKSAVNSLKLAEYDRSDDIIGIELINPCNSNTTPLCDSLACGDDHSKAFFDSDENISDQFESDVNTDFLFDGFDPLPAVPPFHFNCRTEIVPVTE